jgi:putative transposase
MPDESYIRCTRTFKLYKALVDGFTFTMPDTPANQAVFPQLASQQPGLGFPIARACVVLSLATASIEAIACGPYAGPGTGETALLRQVLADFQPGEVMLADRYFCSFFMLALLKQRGVDVCMRLHQQRQVDEAQVTWLGPNDYLDTWRRPARAKWMSEALYRTIPEQMTIRIVTFDCKTEQQTEPLEVVTTLLDPQAYPAATIGQLYGYRWHAELDILAIKQTLKLEHLRCKSPAMIDRELWATLLAYNMVRVVCAQAAAVHDRHPRQMSFTLGCNVLLSQWLAPPPAALRQTLGRFNLRQLAGNPVGQRPGRIEPRVIKRRKNRYPLMTRPRHQYQPSPDHTQARK